MVAPPARSADGPARGPLIAALLAVYVIWGSTYLVMRVALETVPPMTMGAIRFSIAGAVLLAWGRWRQGVWPTRAQWLAAVPIGALLFVGGNGLVAIGELDVSSSVAAVVVATMPLWVAVFAALAGERPTRREVGGVVLGVAGVVVLVSGAELAASPMAAAVLCISPLAWAAGSMLSRRWQVAPGVLGSATFQLAGGASMAVTALLRGEPAPTFAASTAWSMPYLIVLGSIVGFSAYAWLLQHARPALATSYAFVNPPLAVLLGVALGNEQLGLATLAATPLIVAAVVLVVGRKR